MFTYHIIIMKKYSISILLIGLVILSSCTRAFDDTIGHTYQSDISQLSDLNIVQGYPGNLFKPDQTVTRAEMLKIVM